MGLLEWSAHLLFLCQGDLIIAFSILFPSQLSGLQQTLLKAALFLPQSLSSLQAEAVKAFSAAYSHPVKGWSGGLSLSSNDSSAAQGEAQRHVAKTGYLLQA